MCAWGRETRVQCDGQKRLETVNYYYYYYGSEKNILYVGNIYNIIYS